MLSEFLVKFSDITEHAFSITCVSSWYCRRNVRPVAYRPFNRPAALTALFRNILCSLKWHTDLS